MDRQEFTERRQELIEIMGEGSMAIIPTALQALRSGKVYYPYHPYSNFYYLTGFAEPDAVAVIIPQREQGQYILFCRERNSVNITWHGQPIGLEGACELYGADDAFPITDMDEIVPGLMESCRRIYYPLGYSQAFDEKVMEWLTQLRERVEEGVVSPKEVVTLDHVLHEMRLYKSELEIAAMKQAIDLTIRAHQRLMNYCRPGLYEYELEAEIMHEFLRHGCRAPAYPPIVAGGKNVCTIHYTANNCILQEDELVVVDIGAEVDYYVADITRTYPINGRFTKPQKAIYDIVFNAQRAAINKIYPGNHWHEPYQAAVEVITQGLRNLGLLIGKLDVLMAEEAYKRFAMSKIGHWIGMDVHDPGEYKIQDRWRELEPGMVMTVEPGIYIPQAIDISDEWWNIGVRIEDMVLVTENGHEVLTLALPKTVAEIEALMLASFNSPLPEFVAMP